MVTTIGSSAYNPEHKSTMKVKTALKYPDNLPLLEVNTLPAENIPIVYTIKKEALGKLISGRRSHEKIQLADNITINTGVYEIRAI